MRYCKRTFFNKLMQPRRIGKPIRYGKFSAFRFNVHGNREHYSHVFRPRTTMLSFRRGKTPKNQIIGRYEKVRRYRLWHDVKLRITQSIFVTRAKRNVS